MRDKFIFDLQRFNTNTGITTWDALKTALESTDSSAEIKITQAIKKQNYNYEC